MGYNSMKHSPYMTLTASQRAQGRRLATKTAAYYDTPEMAQATPYRVLAIVLANLRALYMIHQTAHWQTSGGHFYADHLLYQRLYDGVAEEVDGTAERLMGLSKDPRMVCPVMQVEAIQTWIKTLVSKDHSTSPEDLVQRSLRAESVTLKLITTVKSLLKQVGSLTEGLDDMLQAMASKHEEHAYLLGQRLGSAGGYDRG